MDRAERLAPGGLREKGWPVCYQLRGVSQSLSIGLFNCAAKHVNVIEPCGDVRNNVAVWVAEVDGGRLSRREGKVCLSLPPSVRPEKADAAGPA